MQLDVVPEVPEALLRAWEQEDEAIDWEALAAAWPDPDERVMHGEEHLGGDDAGPDDDERLAMAMTRTVDPADLLLLAEVDPARLPSKKSQLAYAQRVDHVAALAASLQATAHVALAGPESTDDYLAEQHIELEIALARRIGEGTAGHDVELARALRTTFAAFHEALARGEISPAHCRRLVEATRPVVDPTALEIIGRLALPLARTLTPGRFTHQLRLLIETHDPDAAARRKRARVRDVWLEKLDNGLGRLVYVDEWLNVSAVFERLRKGGRGLQVARKRKARGTRTSRAAATPAPTAASGTRGPATPAQPAATPTSPSARPTVDEPSPTGRDGEQLVVPAAGCGTGSASPTAPEVDGSSAAVEVEHDADTADDAAPDADVSTDIDDAAPADGVAEDADASAGGRRADVMLALTLGKRLEDGTIELDLEDVFHVEVSLVVPLSVLRGEAEHAALLAGQPIPAAEAREWERKARTYRRMVTDDVTGYLLDKGRMYNAGDVRDHVLHRDGCRIPVCPITRHDRLQADHAVPHPEGPTSSANMGGISITHHQLKTAGYFDIEDSQADGSCVIATRWGQRIVVPPRAFLHPPDQPDPGPPAPYDDSPDDDDPPRPTDDDPPPF